MSKALIISDGKKGHLNQSIAFCKYMELDFDIVEVRFKNRFFKSLSYLLDRVGLYTISVFDIKERFQNEFRMTQNSYSRQIDYHPELVLESIYYLVIGAGSSTYYAVKTIAKQLKSKSISMMLPRGLRYNFDLIFAQTHDNPPKRKNIIEIPANFSYPQPQNIYNPTKQSIGIIIGGNNSSLYMDKKKLKEQLDFIKEQFKDYEIAITTSPRTPREIEELIISYKFDYEVIYSLHPINPIPDFLKHCKTLFITSDSTSMISEAISFGDANVVVLPLVSKKENKFSKFISRLEFEGYLHIFNGIIINRNKKFNFADILKSINFTTIK